MKTGMRNIAAFFALILPMSVWAGVTTITLNSDEGDWIGSGGNYIYINADAVIDVTATGSRLNLVITGDENWRADFQLPDSYNQLEPGTYTDLTRYPFHDPAVGGLDWSGEGHGCNTSSSWMIIDKVTYVAGELSDIEMRFEQHCGGAVAALHGDIKWYADDTTTPPGPVTPVPEGLWNPDPALLPTEGNFVYLESDQGDYIGQGATYIYNEPADPISISYLYGVLGVSVGDWTYNSFTGMNTITELEPGYYGDVQRHPFHNPTKGGMSWGGMGRGCNELTAWFAVDNIRYVEGEVAELDLRFEQHCEGVDPALRGIIHWVNDSLPPPPPAAPIVTGEVHKQGAWLSTQLFWTTEASRVDIYYNGEMVGENMSGDTWIYRNRKQFTQVYKVCNTGTQDCGEFLANVGK